ncbi:hypothetical protein [Kozakia baliensis]|nr:hypothetical protein [Kozakia baliensis]
MSLPAESMNLRLQAVLLEAAYAFASDPKAGPEKNRQVTEVIPPRMKVRTYFYGRLRLMKMQREMNFLTKTLTDPDHRVFGDFCSLAQKSLPELNSCLSAAMARRKTGAQSEPQDDRKLAALGEHIRLQALTSAIKTLSRKLAVVDEDRLFENYNLFWRPLLQDACAVIGFSVHVAIRLRLFHPEQPPRWGRLAFLFDLSRAVERGHLPPAARLIDGSAPAARHAQDAYVCIRNGRAGAPETSTCRTRFMLLKHHFHSVGHILGAMNILSSAVEDPSTGARADWPETKEDLGYRDIRAGHTILHHTDWDDLTTGTIALALALQNELTVKQQTKPSPEPILRLHELVLIKGDIKAAELRRGHRFTPEYRKKRRPISPLTGIAFEPEPLFGPKIPKGFNSSTWITTSAFSCQAVPSYRENDLFPTSLASVGQDKTEEAIDHDAEDRTLCVITFSEVPEVFLDIFRKYIPPNQK